jgi:hypothetical protein
MVTVEVGGRVINADAGGPVESVQVSFGGWNGGGLFLPPRNTTTSADGTFLLPLNLPSCTISRESRCVLSSVYLGLTAPPGYDDTHHDFQPTTGADRPAIRMYPTLVIKPGESIEVHVEPRITSCGDWEYFDCRRVRVEGSPGQSVEVELVPDDASKPMSLSQGYDDDNPVLLRLMVTPGDYAYVYGVGTARLTARR